MDATRIVVIKALENKNSDRAKELILDSLYIHGFHASLFYIENQPSVIHAVVCNDISDFIPWLCDMLTHEPVIPQILDVPDASGFTPLHAACLYGRFLLVRQLLHFGANPCARDRLGTSALMFAASPYLGVSVLDRCRIVYRLLKKGADINAQDHNGSTALMHAVKRIKNVQVVNLFLKYGADVYIKDNFRNTAFDVAVRHGRLTKYFEAYVFRRVKASRLARPVSSDQSANINAQ